MSVNMTNLVCSIIFVLTAIAVIIYDYKKNEIPFILVLVNYISFCMLVHPVLLFGTLGLFLLKYKNKPIDIIYIIALGISLIILRSSIGIVCIFPIFIQLLISKKDKICLMVSIELACMIYLYMDKWSGVIENIIKQIS